MKHASTCPTTKAVERLLKNNAGPNARDASDRAPLHTAIWFGKNAMITLLLDNNADINQVGNFGMPPLHLAAWVQDFVAVQELFERGASPSTRIKINGKGEEKTAKGVLLSIAREKRKPDFERINKLLLDATNRRTSIAAQKQER
ncbi:hypothetical protein LTR99_006771 [Exophiala xenobiotica]|uniref:Ankyrin repeat domain-containing protein n=1 Tax=Vermiconidia calcicola TaxID=1690605 RepID=A0AAV9Q0U7_9PEZI|nr:hypothetical protein LTR92_006590 [Exophiala xenobiotica]KAK5531767.1 hypothetical protein LTR25_008097 [Vermiconidia calcicola]KAK5542764.1 hypothetical protein LTR23_005374 [Chaetothyriales sp. CCFEE 6169]KAK5204747.1 hypothetical protein LTR41_009603 [Exophiala xenobiotica]KAK5232652.1 hypothetical protein LTR47_006216 [Exophiala xenobiotica]